MDFVTYLVWGSQALLAALAGILWSEIRKLRDRCREMEKRLSDHETRIAENYAKRSEIAGMLAEAIHRIEGSIDDLERHINDKFDLIRRLMESSSGRSRR